MLPSGFKQMPKGQSRHGMSLISLVLLPYSASSTLIVVVGVRDGPTRVDRYMGHPLVEKKDMLCTSSPLQVHLHHHFLPERV